MNLHDELTSPMRETAALVDVLPLRVPEPWFRQREDSGWVEESAAHLGIGGSVTLSLSEDPDRQDSAELVARARNVLRAVKGIMEREHRLPADAYVEVDEESYGTPTAPGNESRFLLPHQDGGHASFPSPREINDSHGISRTRVFSKTVFFKRHSHKMYQGFLITEPGSFPGETYYYNVVAMLFGAYVHKFSRRPENVEELERFLGANIARSLEHADTHRSRYLTLSAMLGSEDLAHHVITSGPRAESEFWPEQYAHLPQLWDQVTGCPCGSCEGPGGRAMCHGLTQALGLSWPATRIAYETTVVGQRGDLLLGNNLFQMHAAFSAPDRRICPVCIVLDAPTGPAYEEWLEAQWTGAFARLGGPT